MKNRIETLAEKLKLSKIPEALQIYLTVNFITKLLLLAKKNTILVVYNRLLKMTYFMIMIEDTLVEGLVRLFRDNVQKFYGLPESIILDRKLQFVVELTKELSRMLRIKTKLLIVFYPQTDEQMEQINCYGILGH